jgi:ubiquinone biosynthesis monooxygenase Coq7
MIEMHQQRQFSILDHCLAQLDAGLRTLLTIHHSERENPAKGIKQDTLAEKDRKHSAGLMRVNHAGEISAQALYQGQAFAAQSSKVREAMTQSAREETDHLAWCEAQLTYLSSHTSFLNPIWYTGSLMLGILAGKFGDKWSLGFVAETEKQVVEHLGQHLQELSVQDQKSRRIVEQMREDEAKHEYKATSFGGAELPKPIQFLMRMMSKVMTKTSYWI